MSVLFLPPSAGAASVPDATETVSGKIRIATSAEATTGTNDLTAMTPLKVKSVVDAAVVGGVTYQGTFDTSSPVDLSNAEKGDLYIISVAGSYQGQTWAVGDHLLVNEDMGGTISPSKIDKVDNTDSVTSVAGKVGAVTLVAGDVSGLAAVATSGAYSDLSGTPTLGTAAAEDVGTLAGDVVQLDGSARLPAVDGSQLLNLPSATVFYNTQIASLGPTLSQITDSRRQHYDIALCSPSNPITMPSATSAAVGGVVSFYNSDGVNQAVVNCPTTLLLSGSSVTSFTVEPYEARSFVWIGTSSLQEITATRIDRLNDVSISSPSGGEALVYNGTLSVFENSTITASVPNASETVAGIIEIATNAEATAATATDKALVPSNLSSINVSTLNNDAGFTDTAFDVIAVTGTTTLSSSLADGHYLVTVDGAHTVTIPAYSADANIVLSFRHINTGAGDATIYYNTGQSQLFGYDTNTGQFSLPLSDSGAMRTFALRWTASAASSQYWYELQPSSLNSLPDVSYTAGAGIDNYVLTYDHATSTWGAEPSAGGGGGSAPTVSVSSPSADQTLSAPSAGVIEEVYVYTPTTGITVNLVSAATVGSGFKYQIKNRSTNTISIDPFSTETIDGITAPFALSVQDASVTLITDGSNWFII